MRRNIAVIGAGISGITLARQLSKIAQVTVFEKSRGYGGRMATRRTDNHAFDHGAKFFGAKTSQFKHFLESDVTGDSVKLWSPRLAKISANNNAVILSDSDDNTLGNTIPSPLYVAQPSMNALCKKLAHDLQVELRTEVKQVALVSGASNMWEVHAIVDGSESKAFGPFDWVISSAPSNQTSNTFPSSFSAMPEVENARYTPCFALMLGYSREASTELPWDLAAVTGMPHDFPLKYVVVNSKKPDRKTKTSILVHSTPDWARDHLEDDRSEVQATMEAALSQLVGEAFITDADYKSLHRWRYSLVDQVAVMNTLEGDGSGSASSFLIDERQHLAACGDWCAGVDVEAAFLSGRALGDALTAMFSEGAESS